jgi:hypothetical protein
MTYIIFKAFPAFHPALSPDFGGEGGVRGSYFSVDKARDIS